MNFLIPMIQSGLGLAHCLALAAVLFCLGLFGLLTQPHLVRMLMGLVLMLAASILNVAAFSAFLPGREGRSLAIVLALATVAQLAIGTGLVIRAYRSRGSLDVTTYDGLGG